MDDQPRLHRVCRFRDFTGVSALTAAVLAGSKGHHPALLTERGRVRVDCWTRKIRDIYRNDLIMAARSDTLYDALG